jgi:uridine kinase
VTAVAEPKPDPELPESESSESKPPPAIPAAVPADAPGVSSDLLTEGFGHELRMLTKSRLFWVGLAIKTLAAFLFASHFATRWFAPFVYDFVHGHFGNPWEHALANGEPLAFPYGPGMLLFLSVSWIPALFTSFDPAGHLGIFLLRIPCLLSDVAICLLLMRWLRMHSRDVVLAYWLNPIVLYATYVHGQLDIIPTALLCVALYLVFTRRALAGGLVFGFALATKAHLMVAFPFVLVFLYRSRRPRTAWLSFGLAAAASTLLLYALPLTWPAFRTMVLGSSESRKLWSVVIPYGTTGLNVYAAPAALLVALLRFLSYRKLNRELTLMFIGALYVVLVALVPPQPGWFIWSIPFVAYLGARFTRTGRFALVALSGAYLFFFFVENPVVFLEAFDPTLGTGFGITTGARLAAAAPWFVGGHAASIAWTALFSTTALTAFEMYRKGVRSNSIYSFRDESFMVGIGGDSGAGKHTIGNDLSSVMGKAISLINGDDDHKWERGHAMWRRFTHLDPRGNLLSAQMESLAALRRGGDIHKRHYDHDKGRFTEALLLKPNDFVAIIGLHPFYLASQRQLFHLKIFVDTQEELRRSWKVARDIAKRGYTKEKVIEQIEQRMTDSVKYVRPQAKHADLVLRHGPADIPGETGVSMEVELASPLEPLALLDVLDQVPTLTVEWEPDEALTRDRIRIKGEADLAAVKLLALALIPNLEELTAHPDLGWQAGGRGIAQVVILHALSARLRSTALPAEAP